MPAPRPILILRHEYEYYQREISEAHVNENLIKALAIDTFEILQQEKKQNRDSE